MPRNPFEEDNQPHEAIKGEDIINTRTERVIRIRAQDGTVQDIVLSVHESRPDENGNFIDTELINVVTDHAGNPLPEDPRSVFVSHSDLFIRSQEQLARCNSWLHPPNRSRNILLGQDGRTVQGGAICSNCDSWHTTIFIAFGILGLGVLTGLCKAAGLF